MLVTLLVCNLQERANDNDDSAIDPSLIITTYIHTYAYTHL